MKPPQHILITGAAGAIGAALARAMRDAWPDSVLALVVRDERALRSVATALSSGAVETQLAGDATPTHVTGRVTTHVADLSDLAALPALVERVQQRVPLDGLVNCAGIMRVQQLQTWKWDDAHSLLTIDLLAPLRLQDLVVRGMVERGSGVLVNVASMAGRVPLRGCTYYGAAKAGLAMASEIARAELGEHGVRVVTVYPGPVRSAL